MMAKESVELSVTPESTKSCGVELRRYSAGKASSGNSDEKMVPHYLRASTGSCHDFCKYGREHAFEIKERRSIPKRATRKSLHQSSEESIGGIVMSVAKLRASVHSKPTKKMSVVKLRESVDSELQISDTSDTNKQELPTKSPESEKQIGNEVLLNRNKTSLVKVKPSLLVKSDASYIPKTMRQEISSTFKEVEAPSKSTSRKVETLSKSNSKKVETPSKSTSKKMETPSKSTSKKVETPSKSTFEKVETPSKSTSKKVETPSKSTSKMSLTSSKSTSKVVKTSSKSTSRVMETSSESSSLKCKEMKLSEKCVTSLDPDSVTRKTISSMNSSEGSGGQRHMEIKMEKGAAFSKVASRKVMAPLRASLSPKSSLKRVASINARKHKSLKIVSHLKNQPKPRKVEPKEQNNNVVEEKTLYVIKMESENKTFQSDQNASYDDQLLSSPRFSLSSISQSSSQVDQEESDYTTSELEEDSISGNHEIEYMGNGETLEAEEKGNPRKDGIVCSEDKDCQMLKLKFRRGKVVETQIEKSSPRRLKFRRGKVSGEKANVKADAKRKSFKRRDGACADSTGATTGPEKVVLRHQDLQGKKDAQGLFNNVIEETASKLVETRKSKVKALVGAFETVISLQEKKPSANTVS